MFEKIETFWVVLFLCFINGTQGGEITQRASLSNDLYTSSATFFINQTHSPRGDAIFRELQLRLGKNWVPENSSITLIETPLSHNRTSKLTLLCNTVPIGGAWINHGIQEEFNDIVNRLFWQLQWYKGRTENLHPQELFEIVR